MFWILQNPCSIIYLGKIKAGTNICIVVVSCIHEFRDWAKIPCVDFLITYFFALNMEKIWSSCFQHASKNVNIKRFNFKDNSGICVLLTWQLDKSHIHFSNIIFFVTSKVHTLLRESGKRALYSIHCIVYL